jgi:hypothetical protein
VRVGTVACMDAPEYETSVVRLFVGHANSVIWFSDPVPYEESHLTGGLVGDMREWEQSYYAGLDDDFEWRSAELPGQHNAEGRKLALRLAEEIGNGFQVELHEAGASPPWPLIRSDEPASNPEAAAAFRARADAARKEWQRSSGGTPVTGDDVIMGGWFARSSDGDRVFRPIGGEVRGPSS